jgi:hypothetical protein
MAAVAALLIRMCCCAVVLCYMMELCPLRLIVDCQSLLVYYLMLVPFCFDIFAPFFNIAEPAPVFVQGRNQSFVLWLTGGCHGLQFAKCFLELASWPSLGVVCSSDGHFGDFKKQLAPVAAVSAQCPLGSAWCPSAPQLSPAISIVCPIQ